MSTVNHTYTMSVCDATPLHGLAAPGVDDMWGIHITDSLRKSIETVDGVVDNAQQSPMMLYSDALEMLWALQDIAFVDKDDVFSFLRQPCLQVVGSNRWHTLSCTLPTVGDRRRVVIESITRIATRLACLMVPVGRLVKYARISAPTVEVSIYDGEVFDVQIIYPVGFRHIDQHMDREDGVTYVDVGQVSDVGEITSFCDDVCADLDEYMFGSRVRAGVYRGVKPGAAMRQQIEKYMRLNVRDCFGWWGVGDPWMLGSVEYGRVVFEPQWKCVPLYKGSLVVNGVESFPDEFGVFYAEDKKIVD